MDAHRRIAEAADEAWGRVALLLAEARTAGASRADLDALEDHHNEVMHLCLRAQGRARREKDRRSDPPTILAALDYDPSDTFAEREDNR